jgi:ABC-type Fe3+-hydroxamate transport system substrate-binding protein
MTLRTFTDQLGNAITISFPPQRIISLVPSQTELLSYLDLESHVVGITKFCVHPAHWQKTKEIIGGTKNFNIDRIESLKPDLIIGNKEENYIEGIEQLKSIAPVWMSDISSLRDACTMIEQIGQLTDTTSKAASLVRQIQTSFLSIEKLPILRTLYLIWRNPWMAAASGTFIDEMITLSGLRNCLKNESRYPEISKEKILELNPEIVLLSSEPYPFQQKHIEEVEAILPNAKILLVDGELFSWYGSRLLKFPEYINVLRSELS